jgi:hypothetical protein
MYSQALGCMCSRLYVVYSQALGCRFSSLSCTLAAICSGRWKILVFQSQLQNISTILSQRRPLKMPLIGKKNICYVIKPHAP